MSDVVITGLRGTGDWETGQQPQNWHEGILYEFPNGDMPLTGLTSMMAQEELDDAIFNWWTQALPTNGGAVTSVYINAAMSTEYVYATHQATFGIAGATVYVKVAEAVADYFRISHQVLLRDNNNTVDVNAEVISVLKNGASSRIGVTLMEADDNGSTAATYNLGTVDYIHIMSGIQAQGAAIPDAVSYNPTLITNYAQIQEHSLALTRTAKKTRLRTGPARAKAQQEALEDHGRGLENIFWFGVKRAGTGENAQPKYSTMGIFSAVRTYASDRVFDFRFDTTYAGEAWLDKGEEFMDEKLEIVAREGADARMGFAGSGATNGLTRAGKMSGNIQLEPIRNAAYGMSVRRWEADAMTVNLRRHPLFGKYTADRYKLAIVPLERITYCYVDDTFFKEDTTEKTGGVNSIDGSIESYLTEAGLKISNFNEFALFDGIGQDSLI